MTSPKQVDKTIRIHPLMTATEVAQVLGVGERTIWRMASRSRSGVGQFPKPIRVGGKVIRWRWEDLEKYIQNLGENSLDVSARQR